VSLVLLGRRGAPEDVRRNTLCIAAGALICDAPMFGFYLWQRLVEGHGEASIWSDLYFRPEWQNLFDIFNSVPLMLLGLAVAALLRRRASMLFFASMLLHVGLDLPFHVEDAHRHFYPLSEWRFESTLSYWDPAYFGGIVAFAEMTLVWTSSALLWRRSQNRWVRGSLLALSLLYGVGWTGFYVLR
jgi:hypothetical protein